MTAGSCGAGVYIGRNHNADDPSCTNQSSSCHGVATNVHIQDLRSLYNSRQGMSIVAGVNITGVANHNATVEWCSELMHLASYSSFCMFFKNVFLNCNVIDDT